MQVWLVCVFLLTIMLATLQVAPAIAIPNIGNIGMLLMLITMVCCAGVKLLHLLCRKANFFNHNTTHQLTDAFKIVKSVLLTVFVLAVCLHTIASAQQQSVKEIKQPIRVLASVKTIGLSDSIYQSKSDMAFRQLVVIEQLKPLANTDFALTKNTLLLNMQKSKALDNLLGKRLLISAKYPVLPADKLAESAFSDDFIQLNQLKPAQKLNLILNITPLKQTNNSIVQQVSVFDGFNLNQGHSPEWQLSSVSKAAEDSKQEYLTTDQYYRWLKSRQVHGQAQVMAFAVDLHNGNTQASQLKQDIPALQQLTEKKNYHELSGFQLLQNKINLIRWRFRQYFLHHFATGIDNPLTEADNATLGSWYQLDKKRQQSIAVTLSLLTGDRGLLSQETKQLYQLAGISHLLAISGAHVLFLAIVLSALVSMLCNLAIPRLYQYMPRYQLQWLVMVIAAAIYALFTGFDVPAARTFFMLIAIGLAKNLFLQYSPRQVLLIVAVLMAIYDPFVLWQAGYWLSFIAVMLLISFNQQQQHKQLKIHESWQQSIQQSIQQATKLGLQQTTKSTSTKQAQSSLAHVPIIQPKTNQLNNNQLTSKLLTDRPLTNKPLTSNQVINNNDKQAADYDAGTIDDSKSMLGIICHSIYPFVKLQAFMFIALLPICLLFFEKTSIWGLFTNLFAIGIYGWFIVPLNLLAGLFYFLFIPAATILWLVVDALVWSVHSLMQHLLQAEQALSMVDNFWLYTQVNAGFIIVCLLIGLPFLLPKQLFAKVLSVPPMLLLLFIINNQRSYDIKSDTKNLMASKQNIIAKITLLTPVQLSGNSNRYANRTNHYAILLVHGDDKWLVVNANKIQLAANNSTKQHTKKIDKLASFWLQQLKQQRISALTGVIIQTPNVTLYEAMRSIKTAIPIGHMWLAGNKHLAPQEGKVLGCASGRNWQSQKFDTKDSKPLTIKALTGWQQIDNPRQWQCALTISAEELQIKSLAPLMAKVDKQIISINNESKSLPNKSLKNIIVNVASDTKSVVNQADVRSGNQVGNQVSSQVRTKLSDKLKKHDNPWQMWQLMCAEEYATSKLKRSNMVAADIKADNTILLSTYGALPAFQALKADSYHSNQESAFHIDNMVLLDKQSAKNELKLRTALLK